MGARFFLFCRQFSKRARTSSSLAGVVGAAVNFIGPPVFQGFRPTVPQLKIFFMHACRKGTTKFNERLKQKNFLIQTLKMRVGIHTGPVVVGTLGNNLRVEFKAVGDTVNVASRMASLAEPGTTYISESAFKATEGIFRVEALGEKPIKGKKDPVRVFRVIAISSRRTKFDVRDRKST